MIPPKILRLSIGAGALATIGFGPLAACGEQPPRIAPAEAAAARIAEDVAYLADDAREGRDTGSAGYRDAALYVAKEFEALGLSPGVAGGWFQEVRLRFSARRLDSAQLTLTGANGRRERLRHLEDYLIGRSLREERFSAEGPLAFVGFGVTDAASGHDDYRGVDAAGRVVVAFGDAPAAFDSEKRAHFGAMQTKLRNAAAHGAIALILVPTIADEEQTPWPDSVKSAKRSAATWIGPDGAAHVDAPAIRASAYLSAAGAAKLFEGAPKSFDALRKTIAEGGSPAAFALARAAKLSGASVFRTVASPNVVGVIEGADPALKNEVLVITAHLDHVGRRRTKKRGDDEINNGAMDNAMGVATMIETASLFKEKGAPRRTIAFVAVTGEEKGLLGSDYFARHPTLGGRTIVANVNLDMPLMLYPFTDVIAFGAERSTLGPMAAAAAAEMGIAVSPDPFPEEGLFTRSDHYRFVEQGVPSLFLFNGLQNGGDKIFEEFLKKHYHKPSDDLTLPIDYAAAARFADLNYRIARRIADDAKTPRWNEGDFFGELFGK